eukprot:gene465-413_t
MANDLTKLLAALQGVPTAQVGLLQSSSQRGPRTPVGAGTQTLDTPVSSLGRGEGGNGASDEDEDDPDSITREEAREALAEPGPDNAVAFYVDHLPKELDRLKTACDSLSPAFWFCLALVESAQALGGVSAAQRYGDGSAAQRLMEEVENFMKRPGGSGWATRWKDHCKGEKRLLYAEAAACGSAGAEPPGNNHIARVLRLCFFLAKEVDPWGDSFCKSFEEILNRLSAGHPCSAIGEQELTAPRWKISQQFLYCLLVATENDWYSRTKRLLAKAQGCAKLISKLQRGAGAGAYREHLGVDPVTADSVLHRRVRALAEAGFDTPSSAADKLKEFVGSGSCDSFLFDWRNAELLTPVGLAMQLGAPKEAAEMMEEARDRKSSLQEPSTESVSFFGVYVAPEQVGDLCFLYKALPEVARAMRESYLQWCVLQSVRRPDYEDWAANGGMEVFVRAADDDRGGDGRRAPQRYKQGFAYFVQFCRNQGYEHWKKDVLEFLSAPVVGLTLDVVRERKKVAQTLCLTHFLRHFPRFAEDLRVASDLHAYLRSKGFTALHWAIYEGEKSTVAWLLEERGCELDVESVADCSALVAVRRPPQAGATAPAPRKPVEWAAMCAAAQPDDDDRREILNMTDGRIARRVAEGSHSEHGEQGDNDRDDGMTREYLELLERQRRDEEHRVQLEERLRERGKDPKKLQHQKAPAPVPGQTAIADAIRNEKESEILHARTMAILKVRMKAGNDYSVQLLEECRQEAARENG